MRIRWNYLRALGSILIPVLATFALVGWAEQQVRFIGGRVANAPAVATATLSAYPLPGQPSGPSSAKSTATPTRLAAYPLPGSVTPTPTASKAGPPPLAVSTSTLTNTLFLPIVAKPVGPKGTAGIYFYFGNFTSTIVYSNELAMGVNWGYQWNYVFTTTYRPFPSSNQTVYDLPYQVVNQIRSKSSRVWDVFLEGCPGNPDPYSGDELYNNSPSVQAARRACVADVAHSRPGMYWLIWNEPDLSYSSDNDGLSPGLAATYFKEISDTIRSADPTARLIVGNVGSDLPEPQNPQDPHGGGWLSAFVTSYTLQYGASPTDSIAGYGFHAYSSGLYGSLCAPQDQMYQSQFDPCLLYHFTSTVLAGANWVNANDIGKELWITELNWRTSVIPNDTWDIQTRRMSDMCNELRKLPVTRYGWFLGVSSNDPALTTESLFLSSPIGALSPAGDNFGLSCP